jgi:hypothetical protein
MAGAGRSETARYDLASLPTGGAWPFAWWCRGCGRCTAVDALEHCRECVPPLEEVLRTSLRAHVDAHLALTAAGVSPQDPEALGHLDAAHAALQLARELAGVVADPEDEERDGAGSDRCSDPEAG